MGHYLINIKYAALMELYWQEKTKVHEESFFSFSVGWVILDQYETKLNHAHHF